MNITKFGSVLFSWSCFFKLAILLLVLQFPLNLSALESSNPHFSTFATGTGPSLVDGTYHLLDGNHTLGQSNALAFDLPEEGSYEEMSLNCRLRVLEGAEGGAFIFLNTAEYGKRGPAPFVKSWVEPNLVKTFAVGIDVHDPKTDERLGALGNYQGFPEREVSLHWDGREIVKRVAAREFRGDFTDCNILVRNVIGGAEITLRLAGETLFDGYFVAGMFPYRPRLAVGAETAAEKATEFDVRDVDFSLTGVASKRRAPTHYELFNHVLTGKVTSFVKEVSLPPANWAYGRIILTLQIHDAGEAWDKWDKTGALSIIDPAGAKRALVPFVTSFRTPCYWQVDITDFRPWLAGKVRFELAAGVANHEDRGFMMSASLDFYHGMPELEPYHVVPLWAGRAEYGSTANPFSDFFIPRTVQVDSSTQAAQFFMTATGHTPVGEFTPSRRTLIFTPDLDASPPNEHRFKNILWKTDCYLNPNRPQFGTWKYARAGWAPGDVVHPWRVDLTDYIVPGKRAGFQYLPEPYDFSGFSEEKRPTAEQISQAIQLVRSYLILYRGPDNLEPAPPLQILEVEKNSNAFRAGLQEEDYLESYDDIRPESIEGLRAAIRAAEQAGKERIPVVILRGTERLEMTVAPGRLGVNLLEI